MSDGAMTTILMLAAVGIILAIATRAKCLIFPLVLGTAFTLLETYTDLSYLTIAVVVGLGMGALALVIGGTG